MEGTVAGDRENNWTNEDLTRDIKIRQMRRCHVGHGLPHGTQSLVDVLKIFWTPQDLIVRPPAGPKDLAGPG
jgi:hypothetical protein